MEVVIGLDGLVTNQDVLSKFGDVFELGSPNGNHLPDHKGGWGLNWDAFEDAMMYVQEGGIWGTSQKFVFTLMITIHGYVDLKRNNPEGFSTLRDTLASVATDYTGRGLSLEIAFVPAHLTNEA